ncbi:uncharacterized protein LOC144368978 [Ictidomys tridecemlineatus]
MSGPISVHITYQLATPDTRFPPPPDRGPQPLTPGSARRPSPPFPEPAPRDLAGAGPRGGLVSSSSLSLPYLRRALRRPGAQGWGGRRAPTWSVSHAARAQESPPGPGAGRSPRPGPAAPAAPPAARPCRPDGRRDRALPRKFQVRKQGHTFPGEGQGPEAPEPHWCEGGGRVTAGKSRAGRRRPGERGRGRRARGPEGPRALAPERAGSGLAALPCSESSRRLSAGSRSSAASADRAALRAAALCARPRPARRSGAACARLHLRPRRQPLFLDVRCLYGIKKSGI